MAVDLGVEVAVPRWARSEAGMAAQHRPHTVRGWLAGSGQKAGRVTDQQDQTIRRRFQAVDRQLRRRGVRYMFGKNIDDPEWSLVRIHPGASGLDPREVLDRLLGRAS